MSAGFEGGEEFGGAGGGALATGAVVEGAAAVGASGVPAGDCAAAGKDSVDSIKGRDVLAEGARYLGPKYRPAATTASSATAAAASHAHRPVPRVSSGSAVAATSSPRTLA
jgi:hypothetical protein